MKKLFVVGDSISIHYGPYLKRFVEGTYHYDRKRGEEALADLDRPVGANGGNSGMVLDYLRDELTSGRLVCDVLLLNCGLHDIMVDEDRDSCRVSLEGYRENLQAVCDLVSGRPFRTVWVRSTPVDDARHAGYGKSFTRTNADLQRYNEAADMVMREAGIPVIDLYTFTLALGGEVYYDHVHYKEQARIAQAAFLAGYLLADSMLG